MLNWEQFWTSLRYMAYGMGGIFLVAVMIYLAIVLLNHLPSGKKGDDDHT